MQARVCAVLFSQPQVFLILSITCLLRQGLLFSPGSWRGSWVGVGQVSGLWVLVVSSSATLELKKRSLSHQAF